MTPTTCPAPSPAADTSAAASVARRTRLEQVERRRRDGGRRPAARASRARPRRVVVRHRGLVRRLRRRPHAVAGGDKRGDLVHDPVELEVLRRVHGGDARGLQPRDVGVGDDAADDDRDVRAVQRGDHVRDQLSVRPAQDRQPDHVDALVHGGPGDLRRASAGSPRRRRPCPRRARGRRSARRRWSDRRGPACRRGSSACARVPRSRVRPRRAGPRRRRGTRPRRHQSARGSSRRRRAARPPTRRWSRPHGRRPASPP